MISVFLHTLYIRSEENSTMPVCLFFLIQTLFFLALFKAIILQFLQFCMTNCAHSIECFHMRSRRPYWCPKTVKRRLRWCLKPILWELNSFLMQSFYFVPINLHRYRPREWKNYIQDDLSTRFLWAKNYRIDRIIKVSMKRIFHNTGTV